MPLCLFRRPIRRQRPNPTSSERLPRHYNYGVAADPDLPQTGDAKAFVPTQ